jgi:hypothetical protein
MQETHEAIFVLLTYKSLPFKQERQLLTAEIAETAETSYSKTKEFSAVSAIAAVRFCGCGYAAS